MVTVGDGTGLLLPGCGFGVADFGGVAGKVGKVNDAARSRWAASGGGGGAGLQPILGNASFMVRPMPASETGKIKVGNVGDERWQRSRLFASDEDAQAAKILVLWIRMSVCRQ